MATFITEAPDEDFEETWAIRPNKTQLKRDIAVLQALCEEITQLSPTHINNLGLPDEILVAIIEATKMPVKSARKRQLKFINGLMRQVDIEPIQEQLNKLKTQSVHSNRELHQLESWRDKLLSENSKQALTDFIADYPSADIQQLRQLIRNSQKELAQNKPPKSARLLFRYLREILASNQPETPTE